MRVSSGRRLRPRRRRGSNLQQVGNESFQWDGPDPVAVDIFQVADALPKAMRKLIHEYGFVIVVAMIQDGYNDPDELEFLLMHWRDRRQREWLETDYLLARSYSRLLPTAR